MGFLKVQWLFGLAVAVPPEFCFISAKILANANRCILILSHWNAVMGVAKSKNEPDESSPCIFVVDDEPILLELAQSILGDLHCTIRTFTNPELALKAFAVKPPALLITDFAMHEMDGLQLIRECRRINPQQKILLVSGTVDEAVFVGTGVKPDRFLAKPYKPAMLLGFVRELLGN